MILKIFQVIVYVLLPLAFFSTLLSNSMRRKRRASTDRNDEGSKINEFKAWVGRLNKTKIILALLSGFLVYYAAIIMSVYNSKGELVKNINAKRKQEYKNKIIFQIHNFGN